MLAESVSGECLVLAASSIGSNSQPKIGLLNLSESVNLMF